MECDRTLCVAAHALCVHGSPYMHLHAQPLRVCSRLCKCYREEDWLWARIWRPGCDTWLWMDGRGLSVPTAHY